MKLLQPTPLDDTRAARSFPGGVTVLRPHDSPSGPSLNLNPNLNPNPAPHPDADGAAGFSSRYTRYLLKGALALGLLFATHANAQGCAQCRDNMQSTPPAVQTAYRHAIELLAFSGLTVFAAGAFLLRRKF